MNGKEVMMLNVEKKYTHYAPAVRYGHSLAGLEQYRYKSWEEIAPEARSYWDEHHERPWEEFEALIRLAWEEARPQFLDPDAEPPGLVQGIDDIFQDHYRDHYSHGPYSYRHYALAYHLGYDLAVDGRLRDKSWAEIEPIAYEYWSQEDGFGSWEEIQQAVHYAWDKIRSQKV
jgi:hypothetical protein